MQDLRRTLSGVPSCTLESSRAGWVRVAVLSSANELGRTLISICAPRDACISTAVDASAWLPLTFGTSQLGESGGFGRFWGVLTVSGVFVGIITCV